MRTALLITLFFLSFTGVAQPPEIALHPYGFDPIEVNIPATLNPKLVELTKNWASDYNARQGRYDITNVTENTITVTAFKKNAFYYRNNGEAYDHRIKYEMAFTFYQNRYTLTFTVTEIYIKNDKLLEYKLPDYYTSEGKLKDGYDGLDTTLEKTVNDLVSSHYNYVVNFR